LFSADDLQCGRYFATGRNSATEEECRKEILEFLLSDSIETEFDYAEEITDEMIDEWFEELWKDEERQKDYLMCYEVEIYEHKEPIEEEYYEEWSSGEL